jgi:hypothetical protein
MITKNVKNFILKNQTLIWLLFQCIPFSVIAHITLISEKTTMDAFFIVFYSILIYLFFYVFIIFYKNIKDRFTFPDIHLNNVQKFIIFISFYSLLFYYKFYLYIFMSLFFLILTFIKAFFLENIASKSFITLVKELNQDDITIANHFQEDLPLFDLSKQVIPLLIIATIVVPC